MVRQVIAIRTDQDIMLVRTAARQIMGELGFSLIDQTKLVTAASELARNAVIYAGGGTACLEQVQNQVHTGLRITFEDKGPGIADLDLAMKDGYTTGGGLGLGLGGSKRLVNDFEIKTAVGKGTKVTITRWK